jgi:hypothetical protein
MRLFVTAAHTHAHVKTDNSVARMHMQCDTHSHDAAALGDLRGVDDGGLAFGLSSSSSCLSRDDVSSRLSRLGLSYAAACRFAAALTAAAL